MENAVVYARYSSHNQTENSIEAQVKAAESFASSHKYNIIKVYADRAKTGTNDNRAAFQEMLKDTSTHKFTVIIVWKVDRFGRNREEIALNKHKCRKNGVRIEYVAENITDDPEGVILESVLEGFAEYYSKALSQNSKRGIRNVAEKGGYTGGKPPYGYKIEDGKYTIVPKEAKKIKDVFKMFANGLNFTEIANRLDLKYYNIRIYLNNRSYYDGVYRRCGVEVPGIIPPIITKEEFDAASVNLNNYTKRRAPNKYPLTGKIVCKFCGKKYTGYGGCHKGVTYSYYRSTCRCMGHLTAINKNIIEEEAIKEAEKILKTNEDELCLKVLKKINQKTKNINSAKKKESLVAKKRNLLKLVEDGVLPYEDLRERLIELDAELTRCEVGRCPNITNDQVKNYLKSVRGLINNNTALLDAFINKIIVNPEDKSYSIKFGQSHFGIN